MALTDFQKDWIAGIAGKPIDDTAMDKADKKQAARTDFVEKNVKGAMAQKRDQIDKAQNVIIQNGKGKKAVEMAWRLVELPKGEKWPNRQDLEVDTKEDIGKDTQAIGQEQLDALNDALASILETQNHMLMQIDEEGNRLFSDDDIRRELWTPLVREGVIPENMVPDRFSEEAKMFKGASEVYNDKIKDFSKKSTGKEHLLRDLNLAKEVFSLAGTMASSTVAMANCGKIAELNKQINEHAKTNSDLLEGQALLDYQNKTAELKGKLVELQNMEAYATLATTVVTSGLELTGAWTEASAKKGTDEKWWAGAADKTLGALINVVSKAAGPLSKLGSVDESGPVTVGTDPSKTSEDLMKEALALRKSNDARALDMAGQANMIAGALQAALTGVRFAPTIYAIAKEPDEQKRVRVIADLITKMGEATGYVFSSIASQLARTKDGGDASAALNQIGAAVKTAITKTANAPLVYEALKNGRYTEAAMLLGGAAIQIALQGSSEAIYDAIREDVTGDANASVLDKDLKPGEVRGETATQKIAKDDFEKGPYLEGVGKNQEKAQDLGSAKAIGDIEKEFANIDKSLMKNLAKTKLPDLGGTEIAKLQEKIAKELGEKEEAEAEKKLKEHFTPEAIDKMFEEFGTKMVGYEEMYAQARPSETLDGEPDTEVEKALAAIDRAMAATAELRAKADLINALTGGAAGVIAALVPGAGAVAAAQKVAFDIYALCQASEMHNKWLASMEIAFRASSAYDTAIEKTLANAKITVDRTKVKLVLDSLQLANQVGRCFDPTGATSGIAGGLTLVQALVDFGYKMHNENEIRNGYAVYKDALANPGNRKRARKALRLNSTLAKCAIAYGAVMANDPVAKEAVRISGLSADILANDKDVCKRLVAYLENELNQDPVVLEVEISPKPWFPADRPELTPKSWFEYKAAALTVATPRLLPASAKTPAIDGALAELAAAACWNGKKSYAEAREVALKDPTDPTAAVKRVAGRTVTLLTALKTAFASYAPLAVAVGAGRPQPHLDMTSIAKTYQALVTLNLSAATKDQ